MIKCILLQQVTGSEVKKLDFLQLLQLPTLVHIDFGVIGVIHLSVRGINIDRGSQVVLLGPVELTTSKLGLFRRRFVKLKQRHLRHISFYRLVSC